jgi:hypothetical protein
MRETKKGKRGKERGRGEKRGEWKEGERGFGGRRENQKFLPGLYRKFRDDPKKFAGQFSELFGIFIVVRGSEMHIHPYYSI